MLSVMRHTAVLGLVLVGVLTACGGEDTSESTSGPTIPVKSEELYNPDETEAGELNNLSQETPASDQQDAGTANQKTVFWNERDLGLPDCTNDFKFTHQLANPEDVQQIYFGLGSHIAPHEHMVYWATHEIGGPQELKNPDAASALKIETVTENSSNRTQFSEKIQLYAPTDIYHIDARREIRSINEGPTYVEWGASLTTCNGHLLMLGHIAEPSNAILAALEGTEPECDVPTSDAGLVGCVWLTETFIPAGTPIFKSSGVASGFDFGLMLTGLTVEELQEQPGYGYSITPWRVPSGNAVCPLEYFSEPLRSNYLTRLSDSATGELIECGPFNQDVPGTAMGFWFPSVSPNTIPRLPSEREVDEWETIWLFQSDRNSFMHTIAVGNNTFGLDYGQYSYTTVSEGLVNRPWDLVKPGNIYCTELRESYKENGDGSAQALLLLDLSENGSALTIETLSDDKCGEGPWLFQEGQRTFYR